MLGFFLSTQMLCFTQARSQSKYAYTPNPNGEALTETNGHYFRSKFPTSNSRHPYTQSFNPNVTDSLINPRLSPVRKQTLMEVLTELNNARGAYFLYADQSWCMILVNTPIITPNVTTEKILDQVLKNSGLRYTKVDDRTFVILAIKTPGSAKDPDPLTGKQNGSQNAPPENVNETTTRNAVMGKVRTCDGRSLQGVSITIKGSPLGTFTDAAGAYSLHANGSDILVFSFVGYKSKEMAAGEPGSAEIVMEPIVQPLTEVLVTALGIKRQAKALGYSTSAMDGSLFTLSRETNIGNALSGQVAGVSVAGVATGPYGSSRVLIRGNSSLSGNNQPLYVIDGIPYDNSNLGYANQWGGTDLGDGLSNISPDDIESVVILKGVAASALYGYRGGNGAILITTKAGSRNQPIAVEVNNNFALDKAIDERDYQYVYGQGQSGVKPTTMDDAQAASFYSWGARLDGSPAVNYLGNTYAYSAARDNFSHFLRTGLTNQSSVALSGGNDKGNFRIGLSDLTLGAIVPNSSMQQRSINFNSTYNFTNRLQATMKLNYAFEGVNNRISVSDDPGNVMAPPLYLANSFDIRWMKDHAIHPDGTEWLPGNTDFYFENPYYIAYDYQNKTERNRITGGLTLRYNLLDWLFIQGQFARDGSIFDVTNIIPFGVEYTRSDGVHGGSLTQYELNEHEMNSNFMIGVNKKFGKKISFSANVGGDQQDNSSNNYGIGAVPGTGNAPAGPFIDAGDYNLNNIVTKPPYGRYGTHYRVNSLYGSADLGFSNYLFLSVTARNDWYSTLNINTDHYLYPSVSGSFVFSDAWPLPAWISLGKIRTSFAQSSNGTTPYQNALSYGVQSYTISGQPVGFVATAGLIPNSNLMPVKIEEKELGLTMGFLHDRLNFDLTVYDKHTTRDIVQATVSPTSGYSQGVENIGQIQNKGVELTLAATPVKNKDFNWEIAFNFADNHNKVLYLGGLPSVVVAGAVPRWGSEVSISNVIGMPYGQIMGYAYKRDTRGNIIYSDGVTNPAPAGEPEQTGLLPLGSGVYKQTGGLGNTFHYKSFSLSALVDFKYGAKIYSGTNLLLYFYGLQKTTLDGRDGGYTGKGVMEDGHPNAIVVPAQRYFQDISAGGKDHIAEEFVYDASFIKWRSLSLGYSLPASILKNKFIKGVTVSLVGRNLAILMKHVPNIDPESSINNTNGQGLELSGYPAVRSMGVNINVKF
jgi:TonB-linked SusC/RagA family outer membrane protein